MTKTLTGIARRLSAAAWVVLAACALSGCGVSTLTSSFSGGIFGSSKPETTAAAPSVSEGNLLTAAQNGPGAPPDAAAPAGNECPSIAVVPGDGNVTFMAKGGSDSLAVIHRGEITSTARECSPSINGGVSVKFGFAGRVLLGPQGKAGTVTLPVKIAIMDANRATLKSEQVKLPVTIPPDQPVGYFSVVREILVPVPQGVSPKTFRILVSFDRRAPGAS